MILTARGFRGPFFYCFVFFQRFSWHAGWLHRRYPKKSALVARRSGCAMVCSDYPEVVSCQTHCHR
jgi:hypothetical protein